MRRGPGKTCGGNMERPIIFIDEDRCDGCGQCVLECAEGALAVVDGKVRLISDSYCDGLGACLSCPRDALRLVTREAAAFDEAAALAARAARRGETPGGERGCPGSAARTLTPLAPLAAQTEAGTPVLRARTPTWPLQLRLIPPAAPFLRHADILLAAQCAGFALPDLHERWLRGRVPVIACPKLDTDGSGTLDRLTALLRGHADAPPASLTVLRMSVPCCAGLDRLAHAAVRRAGLGLIPQTRIVSLG